MPRRGADDRVRLLHGPYLVPRLRRGDRAFCLYRDTDVVVTGWTDARISWPRCRPLDVPRTHPSLLVDDELARAVRQESAAAVRFWWGVSVGVVWRWRRALGVTQANNEGSRQRIQAAAEAGAARLRGVPLPPDAVERRRRTALALDLGRYLHKGYHGPRWSDADLALLGTLTDDEVARRTGRSWNAVRQKRQERGIPNPAAGRWAAEEVALLGTRADDEVARGLGRSLRSVIRMRRKLGIPRPCDGRPKGDES
jgi:hypothetical protein